MLQCQQLAQVVILDVLAVVMVIVNILVTVIVLIVVVAIVLVDVCMVVILDVNMLVPEMKDGNLRMIVDSGAIHSVDQAVEELVFIFVGHANGLVSKIVTMTVILVALMIVPEIVNIIVTVLVPHTVLEVPLDRLERAIITVLMLVVQVVIHYV